MENYYVYEWIRLDLNEPFYVGKGKNNRAYEVKKNKFFKDVLSYCKNNGIEIVVSIIEDNLSEEEAYGLECTYIHDYIFDWGFSLTNHTWGGDGGDIVSMMTLERRIEYSKKMSESLKGKNVWPRPIEVRRKISETKKRLGISKGTSNPMYGKNIKDFMTEEAYTNWRNNISKANVGKVHSEETRAKMSKSALGREMSEKTKQKLSILNKGQSNPMFGMSHTKEARILIGKVREKETVVEFSNGDKLYFESRNKCAEYLKDKYNMSLFLVKQLLKDKGPFNSKYKKFKDLVGMKIYYNNI